jgi:uncharacterized protein (UPF0332 family)
VRTLNLLEKCFADGKLQPVEPSRQKVGESIDLARAYLDEARQSVGIGNNRLAMNGVYFAWFDAARAILFRDGIREKSHFCLEQYLATYVADGALEKKWVLLFGKMHRKREQSQYTLGPPPTTEEIEGALDQTDQFIEEIRRIQE